jgi:hypothetical protein
MPRWWLLAVSIALAAPAGGCRGEMSDREYCTRRQTGWEMAFPNLSLSEADRNGFIDTCVTNIARAHANGELARSIRCMDEHLTGHGHAYEQYVAFTRCEVVDPTRAPDAPGSGTAPAAPGR